MEKLTIEQLIAETSFVNYCLQKDEHDVAYWTAWITDHPEYRTLCEDAKKMVLLLMDEPSEREFEMERQRIRTYIGAIDRGAKGKAIYWKWPVAVAAAILLVIGFWQFMGPLYVDPSSEDIVPAWVNQQVPPKKTMSLTLEDGTKVTLAPASKFAYPKTFSDTLRTVRLDGSGFFDVQRQADRPFVIATSDLQIRVLGTSFSLTAFEEDEQLQLALFSGRVAVSGDQVYKEIDPGTALTFDKTDGTLSVSSFNLDRTSPGRVDELRFENAPYKEVQRKLSRHYGVTFRAAPDIDLHFSGKFKQESLENVLSGLTHTTGYRFSVKTDTVFVTPK